MSSQASSQQSLPIVSITEESLENDIINQNNALRTNDSNDGQQCDDNGRHIGDPDVIGDKETTSEEADIRSERDVSHAQDTISSSEDTDRIYQVTSPPMKARIEFRDIGEQNWNECVVTGRAGKVGKTRAGRHKMWANVKMVNDGCMKSVNFDNVEWRYKEESVLLSQSFDYDVIRAQEIEINNLISNGVYTRVDDEGQDYVETRWVLTEKDDEKGNKLVKARLVAKGYQESNVSRTDSPTCGKSNLRMILTIAATNKWKVCSLDIKSAFLQGRELEREVYVKPPKEYDDGYLWKLNKTMYGLKDAPREWYLKVIEVMNELKAQKSTIDDAVFYWKNGDGDLIGVCSCHVDDFTIAADDDKLAEVQNGIKRKLKVSSESEGLFKYIGIEICQNRLGISLNQKDYIREIQPLEVPNRSQDSTLTDKERSALKSLAGQLNWVSTQTRPDIAFGTCEINTSVNQNAKIKDIIRANKLVSRVKSSEVFINLNDVEEFNDVICYTDASYASLPGGASQGAYVIFLKGTNNEYAPVAWKSTKIKRVVKSSLAAEALAMQEGVDHSFVIAAFMKELTGKQMKVIVVTDNESIEKNLKTTNVLTEKRLNMDMMIIREMLDKGEINEIRWVPTDKQLADCLTKKGAARNKLLLALRGKWVM